MPTFNTRYIQHACNVISGNLQFSFVRSLYPIAFKPSIGKQQKRC